MELAKIGYDLLINYASNTTAAEQTASDCLAAAAAAGREIRAQPHRADIAVAADREDLMNLARAAHGRLDLLVNNAGVAPAERTDLLEATEQSFDRLMAVNVKGPYFLTQRVAHWMIELVRAHRAQALPGPPYQPKIVTISSISAYTASVQRGDYCVSKAAVSMITPLFATRLAEYGIRVYEIRPGLIDTDMTAPVRDRYDQLMESGLTPLKRWGTPEDVGCAVRALALDLLPFSTGEVLNVDGGFHLRRL